MPDKVSGFDYNPASKTLIPVEMSFTNTDGGVTSYGVTVTAKACREMIKNKFENELSDLTKNANAIYAVEFGKEAILEVLSQKNCEAIRFAFCKVDKGQGFLEDSIVAIGITSDMKPLKEQFFREGFDGDFLDNPPILKERGNGKKLSEFVSELNGSNISVDANKLTDKLFNFL